jgi:hypothetical protein
MTGRTGDTLRRQKRNGGNRQMSLFLEVRREGGRACRIRK